MQMMNTQNINDVAKEVSIILKYFDTNLVNKISKEFISYINSLANLSNHNILIDINKPLDKQNILEDTKDLISLIYYSYIADEDEKKELIKLWNNNEKIFQTKLQEKYNLDNLFKNNSSNENEKIENTNLPIVVKSNSLFSKLITFIKNIIKKIK